MFAVVTPVYVSSMLDDQEFQMPDNLQPFAVTRTTGGAHVWCWRVEMSEDEKAERISMEEFMAALKAPQEEAIDVPYKLEPIAVPA